MIEIETWYWWCMINHHNHCTHRPTSLFESMSFTKCDKYNKIYSYILSTVVSLTYLILYSDGQNLFGQQSFEAKNVSSTCICAPPIFNSLAPHSPRWDCKTHTTRARTLRWKWGERWVLLNNEWGVFTISVLGLMMCLWPWSLPNYLFIKD